MEGGSQQSPAADPDGHYELGVLAEFEADLCDDPAMQDNIRAHAVDCADCRGQLGELGSLRTELAALPPPAMPASVAARLDAVLDAERRARFGPLPTELPAEPSPSTAPSGRDGGTGSTLVSLAARRSRAPRWLGWAAAAVVLVGSGSAVLGVQASLGRDGDGGSSMAAPANTNAGPALPGGTGFMPRTNAPGLLPTYTRQDIEDNLATILRQAHCDAKNTGGSRTGSSPADADRGPGSPGGCGGQVAGAMADLTRRTRCTSAVNDAQGTEGSPRAVQHVLFEGRPAFVFVFDDGRVVVVGSDCGRDTGPATILFSDR